MHEKITVLGAGSWGTSVANLIAENGHKVNLWCYEKPVAENISNNRENSQYLPGVKLHKNINATSDIESALKDAKIVFEAIPMVFLGELLKDIKNLFSNDQTWVVLSKGIDAESLLLPTQLLDNAFGSVNSVAVVSGPNFAEQISEHCYSAATVACGDSSASSKLSKILSNDYLKVSLSDDVIGVQVASALKNVISLFLGVIAGYGCKENTMASLLTYGLRDMAKLIESFGGKKETAYGFAGVGDLTLGLFGKKNRNYEAGFMIGSGLSISDLSKKFCVLPEGLNTTKPICDLARKRGLDLPILYATDQIVFEGLSVKNFLDSFFIVKV